MNRRRRRLAIPAFAGLVTATGLLLAPPAAADVPAGCALPARSATDLNGDGFDDAAVGDPYATVNGRAEAGTVTVLFGDADGRIGEGARQVLTQADVGQTPEAGDRFGWDVALSRTNLASSCAELLIGSPGEDLSGAIDAGMAHLVSYGTNDAGRAVPGALPLTQAGGGGVVEAGDEFGFTVALAAHAEDERSRAYVGAPGETVGGFADAGAVSIFRGSSGLQLYQSKAVRAGLRVPGTPQAGDRFGAALTVGLLDLFDSPGLGWGESLIIGAPGDTVSGRDGAGSVTVVHEAQDEYEGVSLISQDSAGVPGAAEAGDLFGYSVALSPRVGTTPRTLAVGAPGEDAGTLTEAGSVTLFNNTGGRLVPRTSFSQATAGVPGANEAGDRFGYSLAFGHRATTLLVGIPTENVGSVVNAGAVQPVRVPTTTAALQFPPTITENAPGTPGSVRAGNQFGRSLGALPGQREHILTISSVFAGSGSVYVLSDGSSLPPRSWIPGVGGIPAAGAHHFGWSVSN